MTEPQNDDELKKKKKKATDELKSLKFSKATIDTIKPILELGIDIDIRDDFGDTPLIKAIMCGNTDVAKYLIEKSANLYATNISGETTMMICCKKGLIEVAESLLKKGYDLNKSVQANRRSVLHHAIDGNKLDMVKWLLENGAEVDSETELGWTPLMSATLKGNTEIVLELLKHNANIIHKESTRLKKVPLSALEIAEFYHHDDIVAILKKS